MKDNLKEYENNVNNYIQMQDKQLQAERLKSMQYQNEIGEISSYRSKEEDNLMKYQLELTDDLEIVYHLLCGQYLGQDEYGNELWKDPEDDRLKIFSDYGIKRIMNLLQMYVNKNKLLSYYDLETIKIKVGRFGIELTDLFNNAYELIFYYPSPEELYDKYKKIAEKEGMQMSDDELYEMCLRWSDEELQQKIVNMPIIMQALIDMVHDTYMRSLGGKERSSIRERINISQNASQIGQPYPQLQAQPKMRILNPKTW